MTRQRSFVGVWFLVVAGVGCSVGLQYPGGWSPVASQSDCSGFVGMYGEYGESAEPGEPPRLSALLLTGDAFGEQGVANTAVSLTAIESGGIGVKLLQGDSPPLEIDRADARGQWICRRGRLVLSSRTYVPMEAGTPGLFLASERSILLKARDGSLVFRRDGRAIGLVFLLFPVAVEATEHWYRFAVFSTAKPDL